MRIRQAIILAAGMSTRTYPLTINKPKALLKILNLENIFYLLNGLDQARYEKVVLVVHFKHELIKNLIGDKYRHLQIDYAFQEQPLGTGHAVLTAASFLFPEPFLVINSDDFILPSVFDQDINHVPSLLISHHEQAYRFGVVELNNNQIINIKEKDPQATPFSPVNTGAWFLPYEVLSELKKIKPAEDGEIRLTDIVPYLLEQEVQAVDIQDNWIPMTYPWDLLIINQKILHDFYSNSDDEIPWFLSHVKDNNILDYKNLSVIGSHSNISNDVVISRSVIGQGCTIGKKTQIINSIIGDQVVIKDGNIIKNSIIMENSILESGVQILNTASDSYSNISSLVKGKMVDTGLSELGAIIAENVIVNKGVVIMPGIKIWPQSTIASQTIVQADINSEL